MTLCCAHLTKQEEMREVAERALEKFDSHTAQSQSFSIGGNTEHLFQLTQTPDEKQAAQVCLNVEHNAH